MATLVLHCGKTVGLHVTGEDLLAALGNTGLEHEDTRRHTDSKEEILG